MKIRINIWSILFAFCLFLSGCSGRHGQVTLRIVATTDVHGRIFVDDCLDGSERNGNLAKFSTFLKRERSSYKNLIYLDAGDYLQGSVDLYHDLTAQFLKPCLPATAFNWLGCDASTIGNHDLAAGQQSLYRFLDDAAVPVVCANLLFPDSVYYVRPYTLIERHGVRVAVLGLITPTVRYSIPSDIRGRLIVKDPVEAARYWVPILKEKADVVVGLFHTGYDGGTSVPDLGHENVVRNILAEVPGLDVIVFGHDHNARSGKFADCQGDSVMIVNTGPHATKAAVVTVNVDFTQGDKPMVTADGELVDITQETPDPDFIKYFSGWHDDLANYMDSVICRLDAPLEVNAVLWRNVSAVDYIHSIQMNCQGAEVSLAATPASVIAVPAGDVTIRDVFRFYPADNNMVSVMLKGSEIKAVLENSAGSFYNTVEKGTEHLLRTRAGRGSNSVTQPRMPASQFITAAGINYEVDVRKPQGERIRILSMSDGKPFDPERYYRTTMVSSMYTGSALRRATGLSEKDMEKRFQASASADMRYFILTNMALSKDAGRSLRFKRLNNRKLVPENVVNRFLANDTVDFTLISTNAR